MIKKRTFLYLLFILILMYIPLWVPVRLFLSSLGHDKTPVTAIQNPQLQGLILEKTGVSIQSLKISESPRPFGMMIGIPTKPQLILSRNLYESFSSDEVEYVILHEAGHYALWHGIKELVAGIVLLFVGILLLRRSKSIPQSIVLAVILGMFFGILLIRLGRIHEYQADRYSLQRMSNPTGMITATEKFRNYYDGVKFSENKNKLINELFYRGNPYDNRIRMAKNEIEKRTK